MASTRPLWLSSSLAGNAQTAIELSLRLAYLLVELPVVEPLPILLLLPDLIEALVETGRLGEAEAFVVELERRGRVTNRAWGLAIAGRTRDIAGGSAWPARRGAHRSRRRVARARAAADAVRACAHASREGAGWRAARQRRLARQSLEQAREIFERLGARLWLERAESELRTVPGRRPSRPSALTETEERIARLVADGCSNHEVARRLFMSPKTVEWNLSKVYRKLRIHSRTELAAKLAARS